MTLIRLTADDFPLETTATLSTTTGTTSTLTTPTVTDEGPAENPVTVPDIPCISASTGRTPCTTASNPSLNLLLIDAPVVGHAGTLAANGPVVNNQISTSTTTPEQWGTSQTGAQNLSKQLKPAAGNKKDKSETPKGSGWSNMTDHFPRLSSEEWLLQERERAERERALREDQMKTAAALKESEEKRKAMDKRASQNARQQKSRGKKRAKEIAEGKRDEDGKPKKKQKVCQLHVSDGFRMMD